MNIKAYNVDSVPNNKNYSTNYKMDNLGLKKNVNLNTINHINILKIKKVLFIVVCQ